MKKFHCIAKCKKNYFWMVHQASCADQVHNANSYKFGLDVPQTYCESLEIDNKCGNCLWQVAIDKERR